MPHTSLADRRDRLRQCGNVPCSVCVCVTVTSVPGSVKRHCGLLPLAAAFIAVAAAVAAACAVVTAVVC